MTQGWSRLNLRWEDAAVDHRRMKSKSTYLSPLYPIIDLSVLRGGLWKWCWTGWLMPG